MTVHTNAAGRVLVQLGDEEEQVTEAMQQRWSR